MQALLVPLAEASDAAHFGGKAAGLARLLRAGVPVPGGVVLPPEVPAGEALDAALQAWWRALGASPRVAVRSSAVGEDGASASFAGQFETVLGVDSPDALREAVRRVRASAGASAAQRYAQDRGAAPAAMAVVLQQQVDAVLSGVLFTRDPVDASRSELLVEFTAGLGDRLVAGEITPARARLSRVGGLQIVDEGDDAAAAQALAMRHAAAAAELARHALAMERELGTALDIEWSIARDGRVLLLQCRPMTTAPPVPRQLWSNANIAENFPGPVVPMLQSFVARGYAGYFRGLGEAFGISRRRIDAMAPALEQIVGVHAGRLYYNLSHIHSLLHLAPGGAWLARFFNQFTGAEGTPPPQRVAASALARAFELLRVAICVPWRYARVRTHLARFEQRVDAYAAATHPRVLPRATPAELAQHLRGFLEIRLRRWTDAALADTAAMVCYGTLKALLGRWLPGAAHAQLQNDLLQGLPGLASALPVEKLWALAQRARAEPAVRAVLQREPPAAVREALREAGCGNYADALDDYLDRHGFRYSGELMLTQPTPAEEPQAVVALLQTYLAEERAGPAEMSAERAQARRLATDRTATTLGTWRAGVFRVLLAATQGSIRLRERARMKQALLYTRLRHVALALGDRLVAVGLLASRDDVFFLQIDEAIAAGDGTVASLREIVAARRAEHEACFAVEPPEQFSLPPGRAWAGEGAAARGAGEGALTGVGACGGVATGPAAVILDVTQAGALKPGAILVTRQTDPGWAGVFFLVKGLVVERGGMLSHGAIIAREYGIPAVVGVRGATQRIASGQTLRVDGDAGCVELAGG